MSADLLTAPFLVAAGLLTAAGVAKLRRPDPLARTLKAARLPHPLWLVRLLGCVEFSVGALCLVQPRSLFAAVLGVMYGSFAAFLLYVIAAKLPVESCGCLGEREAPPSFVHVALNGSASVIAFLVALRPVKGAPEVLLDLSYAAVPFLLGCLAAAYLAYLAVANLPELLLAYGHASSEASNRGGEYRCPVNKGSWTLRSPRSTRGHRGGICWCAS